MQNDDMNNKKAIGFDMDGVIIDFSQLRIKLAKDFGFQLRPEQTPSEVIKEFVPTEVVRALQRSAYSDPKTALSPPLIPGVKSALKNINKKNINYFLISRRRDSEIAIRLLRKHNLWPHFFNEKNACFVDSIEGKNLKAIEFGITHYLDDEVKVLEKLYNVKEKFLFDQFSIRSDAGFYTRVSSWDKALTHFLV